MRIFTSVKTGKNLKSVLYHNIVGNDRCDGCESGKKQYDDDMVKQKLFYNGPKSLFIRVCSVTNIRSVL